MNFYCIEDVTIIVNGISKTYPANSNVEISFTKDDIFEIVPTSDNSILTLTAYPGALNTYYSWLEGIKQFSNILFDMNTEDMYTKWSQGNQGAYQVQFAQYTNCIFWSDNAYINDVAKRTNYTLYYSSQLPLCYSNIPDNTFKAFYLALGVTSDPNWGNSVYRDSFAKATWATQAFSYYGARTVGLPGLDSSSFNITLPKDCRGLMFDARNIEYAGTFDATNVTNFGAKSGSWREAFGDCSSLRRLYIKNLKINLNISWSPIDYASIYYIISKAANTNAITISVSPHTWNLLSQSDFDLATSKNITIALITTNYVEDKRLNEIANKANKDEIPSIKGLATEDYVNNSIAAIPSDVFMVTITGDDENGYTADKTFAEIMEAYNFGKICECRIGSELLLPIDITNYMITFVKMLPSSFGSSGKQIIITYSNNVFCSNPNYSIVDTEFPNINTTNKTILGAINELDAELDSHTHNDLYYTIEQIDAMEFITTDDIDAIYGETIELASEVKF